MEYDVNTTHCSGYLCPLNEKCRRFELFVQWNEMEGGFENKPKPMFMSSRYDEKSDNCARFMPLDFKVELLNFSVYDGF